MRKNLYRLLLGFGVMSLVGITLVSCEGYKRFKDLQDPEKVSFPAAPESPIGAPVYPYPLSWLFEHDAVRYGQTASQIKANLEAMPPMCGLRFTLVMEPKPWPGPLPRPFHGEKVFKGPYREILQIRPDGRYVACAVLFDQKGGACCLYSISVFNTRFVTCLPGDTESIEEIRAKQDPKLLAYLDRWLVVQNQFYKALHHVKTKQDVEKVCNTLLKGMRQGSWELKEFSYSPIEGFGGQGSTDNLICMRGKLAADKVMLLRVSEGRYSSFAPMFVGPQSPYPDFVVAAVYLLHGDVVGVAYAKMFFPVLFSMSLEDSFFLSSYPMEIFFWRTPGALDEKAASGAMQ
ncbi:MAG: hypothetical protein P8Z49_00670 [Acidobacteriota bacterium]